MITRLVLCGFLFCSDAAAVDLYVATTGSDTANNCQVQANPCRTGQYVVDQAPFNSSVGYDIHFAAGTYSGEINVTYWRNINLRGDCSNVLAVVLKPSANSTAIVTSQDGAIVGVSCLALDATGFSGNTGLFARQLAIMDFQSIAFFPMGTHINATYAAISCTGPTYIYGGATVHASAGNQAVLTMSCQENIMNAVSISYYAQAGLQSVANWSGASFNGSSNVSGQKYTVQDGSCVNCGAVPGNVAGQVFGSGTVW